MKNLIIAATVFAATAAAAPAMAQNGNTSGDAAFYGLINAVLFGPPQVVNQQPIIIERTRYVGQPVYLRVPPGHQKKWSKHCARYDACGQQVYFVRDEWYTNTYAPRYREQSRHGVRSNRHDRDDGRSGYATREVRHEVKHEGKHGGKHEGKHGGNGNNGKHGNKHD